VNIRRLGKLVLPYLIWMLLLVLVPLLMMMVLTFIDNGSHGLSLVNSQATFTNWRLLFSDLTIRIALRNSFIYAGITTFICFFLGYPMAYIVATSNFSNKLIILVLTIIPMWANSLLRNYGIANLLSEESIIGDLLSNIGISFSWGIKGVEFPLIGGLVWVPSIVIGLVLTYLPFMILPVYTVLEKMDRSLLEASEDLGAKKIKTFLRVTFPLSIKGVTTGLVMVFLPAFSGFAIHEILGRGNVIVVGTLIQNFFYKTSNYSLGSLLSIVVLLIIFGAMAIIFKVDKEGESLL